MQKFEKAHAEHLTSIEKHLETNGLLELSSEEEDDIDTNDIRQTLNKVLSAYDEQGEQTEKILSYLIDLFQTGGTVCLICISTVKKTDAIWNCGRCYSFMHLSCILDWIRGSLSYKHERGIALSWGCPKCRTEYTESEIPRKYRCFCGKTENPPYQVWCIPHSCGESCNKFLRPTCGHKCTLLCHPGPCPPCAKTIDAKCFCGKRTSSRRCNAKEWGCGSVCEKRRSYCTHPCEEACHPGECPPCQVTQFVECRCGARKESKTCAEASWCCDKVCGRILSCGVHVCESVCHTAADCGLCPLERNRSCPCGKRRYAVSCKEQVPTCGDSCEKLLDCGSHYCSMRCHSGKCGQCVEVVSKSCRCGSFEKELPCGKEFHCNKKCVQMRLCGRHACSRKCCDCAIRNVAKLCERVCENTLNCRKHKCSAPCHSGPCYPCARTDVIQCRCGSSKRTVPCGLAAKRLKPPPCSKPCKIPPVCHHPKRETHKCHHGPCPPCKKVCNLIRKRCGHACLEICHTKVWQLKTTTTTGGPANGGNVATSPPQLPSGRWSRPKEMRWQLKTLPCPPCEVSVPVTCLGGHETLPWPCHAAKPSSCGRPCGEPLSCGNHFCELSCHAKSPMEETNRCMDCEKPCTLPRPEGCTHPCPQRCHPTPCRPCRQWVKVPCHCKVTALYRRCFELTCSMSEQQDELLKCGNICPKTYPCGHRCVDVCHPGLCKAMETCDRKVKMHCQCKRIKKEFSCLLVRTSAVSVLCDDTCRRLEEERAQRHQAELALKCKAEKMQNQKEIEMFERKFRPRRRGKSKFASTNDTSDTSKSNKKLWIVAAFLICGISVALAYITIFFTTIWTM